MAKPNYQFEKRQKEMAKKRKQDEKREKKLAQKKLEEQEAADTAGVPAQPGDSSTPT